ncbi:hypothetical protein TNCT_618041 [Trichonephila clavata]|uniref:Uncharacterized protein n=1 Tax=Trichonephila clavata TaxID=2740835 RepID=A0A8X6LW21_TRICU|nr:hypothetical protein TNCT_618041 [Trichonephila clavata]
MRTSGKGEVPKEMEQKKNNPRKSKITFSKQILSELCKHQSCLLTSQTITGVRSGSGRTDPLFVSTRVFTPRKEENIHIYFFLAYYVASGIVYVEC